MRKDYRTVVEESVQLNEIDAVEEQWTGIWEKGGWEPRSLKYFKFKEEYRLMRPYLNKLSSGAKGLDGGCGLGEWMLFLSKFNFEIKGIDISKILIEKLSKLMKKFSFIQSDIRNLPIKDNSIDFYYSWGTFEHFEEGLDSCISEAYRVLKPDAYLFVSVPYDNLRHSIKSIFFSKSKIKAQTKPQRFYQWRLTQNELSEYLSRNGFNVEKVKIVHKRQGVQRFLQQNFYMNPTSLPCRLLAFIIAPIVPGKLIGHMIIAVAVKK
mgnify:CR=1 FL=1